MKTFVDSGIVVIWVIVAVAMLSGCAGHAVQSELTSSHPAHPRAAESEYRRPLNYFDGRLSGAEIQSSGKMEIEPPSPNQNEQVGHGHNSRPVRDASAHSHDHASDKAHGEHAK
jgi:hypothetical protein